MEREGNNLKSKNDSLTVNATRCDSINIYLNSCQNSQKKPPEAVNAKHNNFYKALKLLRSNPNKTELNLSEFSEANMNASKEENVINYLERPITKDIVKIGNELKRVSFHTTYSTSINIPYRMNNIFKTFLPRIVEVDEKAQNKTNNISTFKNKKSTAAFTNKNDDDSFNSSDNRNLQIPEVNPFTLEVIDDLEEAKDIDIKCTNSKEEMLIVDSFLDINSKKQTERKYSTTDKKIPQKFKRNKLTSTYKKEDFDLAETAKGEFCFNTYTNNLAQYVQSSEKVNKNLMNQFNTCTNLNGSVDLISKDTSKSPSAEMIDFLSLGEDTASGNYRKNVISSSMLENNNNITPVKKHINFDTKSKNEETPKSNRKQFSILPTNIKLASFGKSFTKSKSFILFTKSKMESSRKDTNNIDNLNLSNNTLSLSLSITPQKLNMSTTSQKKNSLSILSSSTFINAGQTIYDLEFYMNLLNSEKKYIVDPKTIELNNPDLTWDNRSVLLDWLMQICEEFAFKRDTFHYAINYIDRFLSKSKKIQKSILQLIAITSLSIAAKIEEVQIPKLGEYANTTNNQFSIEDIIHYEQFLLSQIKWEIVPITVNTWVNWYICQWDLFIDTVEGIKEKILLSYQEEDLLYFKKSDDKSYYNFRKVTELIDLISLDYHSLGYTQRFLVGGSIFTVMCLNYALEYNFDRKTFKEDNERSQTVWDVFCNFVSQSFDVDVNDEEFFECMSYCYKFKQFDFNYELPLIYQVEENEVDNGNYEDFVSYQTYNANNLEYLKKIYM